METTRNGSPPAPVKGAFFVTRNRGSGRRQRSAQTRGAAPCGYFIVLLPEHVRLRGWHEVVVRLPKQRLRGKPQHPAEGAVDGNPPVLAILDEDGIGQGIQGVAQQSAPAPARSGTWVSSAWSAASSPHPAAARPAPAAVRGFQPRAPMLTRRSQESSAPAWASRSSSAGPRLVSTSRCVPGGVPARMEPLGNPLHRLLHRVPCISQDDEPGGRSSGSASRPCTWCTRCRDGSPPSP